MIDIESFLGDLPDPDAASRFFEQFSEAHPAQASRVAKNRGLLSDVLTLASFSPLLAATLLQNADYAIWLGRRRTEAKGREKEELLESLARFSLTNSQLQPNVVYARFRRRELLRIFLRDIRRLATISEITEEISELADAILENALRTARQDLDNKYGQPQATDDKGRTGPAEYCIVSLGKLGSRELNYASDIDLLFLYSSEGVTTGSGSRGSITNREYFGKLAQSITRLVGGQSGEGAAYRVDLRLRPHGRIGAPAISIADAVRYYRSEAADWERQVLIRSRPSAGSETIFRNFFEKVEPVVFSVDQSVEDALRSVRSSKEKIDSNRLSDTQFNVKLGRGGIREIEFLAQALQLAHGGRDKWLRSPHTLMSLSRLADRGHLSEAELINLFRAYEFLRRLEHLLQMENGLQTHSVPNDPKLRELAARRAGFENIVSLDSAIIHHSDNVHSVFLRVFGDVSDHLKSSSVHPEPQGFDDGVSALDLQPNVECISQDLRIALAATVGNITIRERLENAFSETAPKYAEMVIANPKLLTSVDLKRDTAKLDLRTEFANGLVGTRNLSTRLAGIRRTWSRLILQLVILEAAGTIAPAGSRIAQKDLAEASIEAALEITRLEMAERLQIELERLPFGILAFGKLGSGILDYESDLDLLFVHDDSFEVPGNKIAAAEFYSRSISIFATVLSGITRDGHLYRVDLRLRPFGRNGTSSISRTALLDYLQNSASIWELLAYLKIRAVGGDAGLTGIAENQVRENVHQIALSRGEPALRTETRSLRLRLEKENAPRRSDSGADIKFGSGGLLDVYFLTRFLQLRDNVPDLPSERSTSAMLVRLHANGAISESSFEVISSGYKFLSNLDHFLRLTVGRVNRLPLGDRRALTVIAHRMNTNSPSELLEILAFHRLSIRAKFDAVLHD